MPKVVLLNCVGLTPRLLPLASRLSAIATRGWQANMPEVLPAVTCTAQATLLTGSLPNQHGIVANGWHFRDTNEVRFWQQSNALIQAEPVYVTAKKRNPEFTCAKLFWWFNQGADVTQSVTPKPWYGVDGNKAFDIYTNTVDPQGDSLDIRYGPFPFPAFWGPMAGIKSTQWIADCSAHFLTGYCVNDLTLVYLPHLDYEPQRRGPGGCDMPKHVKELDDACAPILDAAAKAGAEVWIVSEYGHCDVTTPVYLNRVLHKAGLLTVHRGPFGDQLDLYASRAFAVVDHQVAHISVKHPADVPRVCDLLRATPGVARVFSGEERREIHLDHPRSGEVIALSEPTAWFAYNFWPDDKYAPDYAPSVAIHHKPGFDPCELFFDPKLMFPKLRAARRLLQKKLGFRTIFDVCPLDAGIVRGSHGLAAQLEQDRPLLVGHGPNPGPVVLMTSVKDLLLNRFGLSA